LEKCVAVSAASAPHAEWRAGICVFAFGIHRVTSHLRFTWGHAARWIEVARYESDVDFRRSRCHGAPEFGWLVRPVTLRRHLSMTLPLSLIAADSARDIPQTGGVRPTLSRADFHIPRNHQGFSLPFDSSTARLFFRTSPTSVHAYVTTKAPYVTGRAKCTRLGRSIACAIRASKEVNVSARDATTYASLTSADPRAIPVSWPGTAQALGC
jgi:hypothetical protein